MKKPLLTLIILITTLQVADVLTTGHILAAGGTELNPCMSPIINRPILVWASKGVLVLCATLTAHIGASIGQSRLVASGLFAIVWWYSIVILNNTLAIIGYGGIHHVIS